MLLSQVSGGEKENILSRDSNLQVKVAHNEEDDGAGSDGFELIDVKENLDPAEVEKVTIVPRGIKSLPR
jgi:golgin subfamily A member 4